MKRVALIASVGFGESSSSGQIIRSRILLDQLRKHYGDRGVYLINTSDYKRRFLAILFRTVWSVLCCDCYIIMLSGSGRRVFFPILTRFKKWFRKHLFNNIIGGDYGLFLQKNPRFVAYSNAFDVNWVQMPSMKKEVEHEGVRNVEVLPNSKPLVILPPEALPAVVEKPYRFCTFSRVTKEKGIEDAIRAIEEINRKAGETVAELTIYGKPDEDYAKTFEEIMRGVSSAVHYGGVVVFDETTEVLKDYYMLLFPTVFYGEGFPGTILDAYASGLPVIASDWKFNPELIREGKTGFVYDHKD